MCLLLIPVGLAKCDIAFTHDGCSPIPRLAAQGDPDRIGDIFADIQAKQRLGRPAHVLFRGDGGACKRDLRLRRRHVNNWHGVDLADAPDAAGQVREFTLRQRLRFRARTPAGRVLIPETELVLSRDMSYNETDALAKEQEEAMLYRAMQVDIVDQLMRRLAALPAA